jgi:thiol-disulfide isomerase/thioredoxin
MFKTAALVLSSFLLAASLGASPQDHPREQDLSDLEGKRAPALAVTGWLNSKPLNLADLRGKVVLIDFWGTW